MEIICSKDGDNFEFMMTMHDPDGRVLDYYYCPVCGFEISIVVAEDED